MAPGLLGLGRRLGRTRGRRLCRAALRLVRSAPLLAPALSRRLPLRLLSLLALPLRLVARSRRAIARELFLGSIRGGSARPRRAARLQPLRCSRRLGHAAQARAEGSNRPGFLSWPER